MTRNRLDLVLRGYRGGFVVDDFDATADCEMKPFIEAALRSPDG
jgi:hypothetical protein